VHDRFRISHFLLFPAPPSDLVLDRTDKRYAPTYLTIDVKPAGRVFDTALHNAPVRERLNPLSKLIDAREGKFTHKFEMAGSATICIRASNASSKAPIVFALRVTTSEEVPEIKVAGAGGSKKSARSEKTANVDQHLTHMERELKRITSAMEHVLREADLNKNQDAVFHEQTLAMHSATTFWPIVQVCVLLMTGFTQASHIVRFFKSRRII